MQQLHLEQRPIALQPQPQPPDVRVGAGAAWRYRIGLASPAERDAVEAVRRRAYRRAAEFVWNDEATLGWTAADDAATVLALWDARGALLSTMRASVFTGIDAAEAFLEYSLAGVHIPTPTLVLSRAATAPDAARRGLYALVRYAYLSALAATPIRSCIAIVYDGAVQTRSMCESGYAFFEPRACWDSEAVARVRPLLAVLPRARFERAFGVRSAALSGQLDGVQIDSAAIAASLRARCTKT
jgi:hypothetical protein